MSIFSKIKQKLSPSVTIGSGYSTADDVVLRSLLGSDTTITRKMALQVPEVASNISFIADAFSSVPVVLEHVSKDKEGHKIITEVNDQRVLMLNGDTNDTLSAVEMKRAVANDYFLSKGAYIYINKRRNNVRSFNYVRSEYVTILKNYDPIFKDYIIQVNTNSYDPEDFIKILRDTRDGCYGTSILDQLTTALRTAYANMKYQLLLVEKGGNKKGFLESSKKLGQEEINILKKAFSRMYASNEDNVVILNDGMTFHESSNTAVEMQLNQTNRMLNDEIDKIFHIDYKKSYADFVRSAVMPIGDAFIASLNRDLLLEKEKKTMRFRLDYSELLKSSMKERFEAYKTAKEAGFMTTNEVRKSEGLLEYDGLDTINVGLGSVMYNVKEGTYYTPNTNKTHDDGDHNDDNRDDHDDDKDQLGKGSTE